MSTVTDVRPDDVRPPARSRLRWALVDGLVLAKCNLVQIPRIPGLVAMFVLLVLGVLRVSSLATISANSKHPWSGYRNIATNMS